MTELMQALYVLLELEESARDFYKAAISKAQNSELKADFDKIYKQEIGHVAMVEQMIKLVSEELGPK